MTADPTARISDPTAPLVSIIIPYYMQQAYIADTVRSALAQTYQHIEVIVIDDGSPVPAAPALTGMEGIHLTRTENHGCPITRNVGFSQSSGEFLIFLDGDDILRPDAVQSHLNAFATKPEAGLSFGAVRIIDRQGHQTSPARVCRPRKDYLMMLLETNPIWSPGATMMRRDTFEQAGGFNRSLHVQVDDYDLYLRLARLRPFVRHTETVLDYRLHGENVSKDQEKMLSGTLAVLDRLEVSGELSPAELRRLRYGKRRWLHQFRPRRTLSYRLKDLYYRFRSLLSVAPALLSRS